MKYIFQFLFFLTPSFLYAQPVTDVQQSRIDSLIAHTRSLVQREVDANNYPGLALSVWYDGDIIWSEGFGYASIEDSVQVDPAKSLFRIGSVSKTLTAAGLAKLTERNAIDLNAPIQRYVSTFPEKQWPISTRQIGQHIAGIRHYKGFEFLSNVHYNSVNEALEVFKHDTLLFMPGDKYSYSSYGWNLVSAAIEDASQKQFLEFMQEEVFSPAQMNSTFPDDIHLTELPRVSFYSLSEGNNALAPQVDNSVKWAGGGFLSTSEDLVRFGEAVLNNVFTNAETTQLFWTPPTLNDGKKTNYGLGWATNSDKHGRLWVGHSGGSVGGSSMLLVYPGEKLIVVSLINRSQANAPDLAFTIADQFLSAALK